jgi:hypothetical protein
MDLSDLSLPDTVQQEGDSLPSSGGYLLDTGVYNMMIEAAYLGESSGGAHSLTLRLKQADGDSTHRETIYITSGRAKGQKPYYVRDGKEFPLPGFSLVNDLCILATGQKLAQHTTEEKVIDVWNRDAGAEVPTKVPMIMALVNQPIKAGIVKKRENKRVQQGTAWVDGPEAREFNEIDKFFAPDGRTVTEQLAGAEAAFIAKWQERFPSDFVSDRFKEVAGAAPAASSAAPAAAATPAVDIFSN